MKKGLNFHERRVSEMNLQQKIPFGLPSGKSHSLHVGLGENHDNRQNYASMKGGVGFSSQRASDDETGVSMSLKNIHSKSIMPKVGGRNFQLPGGRFLDTDSEAEASKL